MNTPNNQRRKESQNKIESVFIELLQSKNLMQISVTDICNLAKINRSTFYANYIDVYDLADKLEKKLILEVKEVYADERNNQYNSLDFSKLFYYIKENQIFFKTFFKLDYSNSTEVFEFDYNLAKTLYNDKNIDYHIEFFRAGLNAIIKKWLDNDCKESAQEINEILVTEYAPKQTKHT
jgi:hypothetical protein